MLSPRSRERRSSLLRDARGDLRRASVRRTPTRPAAPKGLTPGLGAPHGASALREDGAQLL
eukprot:3547420-Alexandrium_andersonii.AAC.1